MDGMQGFYGQGYPGMDPQQSMDGYAQDDGLNTISPDTMDTTGLGQAQTLHQIISQNNEELMRRRNTFQSHYRQGSQDRSRRASMLEFGSPMNAADLASFQFDPNPNESDMSMTNSMSNLVPMNKSLVPRRVRSKEDLSLNTRFSQMNTSFGPLSAVDTFNPSLLASTSAAVESGSAFMNMIDFDPMAGLADSGSMQEPIFTDSPMDQTFTMTYQPNGQDPGAGSMNSQLNNTMAAMAQSISTIPQTYTNNNQQMGGHTPLSAMQVGPASTMASPIHVPNSASRRTSVDAQPSFPSSSSTFSCEPHLHVLTKNPDMTPSSRAMNPPSLPHMPQVSGAPVPQPKLSKFANAYSSSGFDMLGVLVRSFAFQMINWLTWLT